MHKHYFYVPDQNQEKEEVKIEGQEYRHCCRSLRKTKGSEIIIFNGTGQKKRVEITEEGHDCAYAKVLEELPEENRVKPQIDLGFGIVRNKAIKKLIKPATVMEVEKIHPITMENCIKDNFNEDKVRRYSIQAAKQSGSSYLPNFSEVLQKQEWFNLTQDSNLKLIPVQSSNNALFEVLDKFDANEVNKISIMVGPEGGFTEDEIETAQDQRYIPTNLFTKRLRTELAVTNILSGIYHYYHKKW